jgi:hypothetical protein
VNSLFCSASAAAQPHRVVVFVFPITSKCRPVPEPLPAQPFIYFGIEIAVSELKVVCAAVEKISVNMIELKLFWQCTEECLKYENIHPVTFLFAADAKRNDRSAILVEPRSQKRGCGQCLSNNHFNATDSPEIRHLVGGVTGDGPPLLDHVIFLAS